MAKPPSNLPSEGDKVKLRGRNAIGRLTHISTVDIPPIFSQWANVKWDEGNKGPTVCHLYELEKA